MHPYDVAEHALAATTLIATAGPALAHDERDHGSQYGLDLTSAQRHPIRKAARCFRNVDKALAAGYVTTCP